MAIFVVGDIHGKYGKLQKLLKKIKFNPEKDELWCTGDLVNRGKKSLEVLQFCHDLKNQFKTVLGNHDLYLLALYWGLEIDKKISKNLKRILDYTNAEQLLQWLQKRPFVYVNQQQNSVLVHAGLPSGWTLSEIIVANKKLQSFFQTPNQSLKQFLSQEMMGNHPKYWKDSQNDFDQYRYLINYFTRMRFCKTNGAPSFSQKSAPDKNKNPNRIPWFELDNQPVIKSHTIIFGHWATLNNYPIMQPNVIHLDTGCAWGGSLTAICLDGCLSRKYKPKQRISVSC